MNASNRRRRRLRPAHRLRRGLVVAPERLAEVLARPASATTATRSRCAALGGREIVLHGSAIAAARARQAACAPWLVASMPAISHDIAATFVGRDGIPDGAPQKTAVVAGGSAALTAAGRWRLAS